MNGDLIRGGESEGQEGKEREREKRRRRKMERERKGHLSVTGCACEAPHYCAA